MDDPGMYGIAPPPAARPVPAPRSTPAGVT